MVFTKVRQKFCGIVRPRSVARYFCSLMSPVLHEKLNFRALSISYQRAEIAVRSQFSLSASEQTLLLHQIAKSGGNNALILSTCNRTEVYCSGLSLKDMQRLLLRFTSVSTEVFENVADIYDGFEAVEHLFNVGCALNSQIIGDTEISGQIKRSLLQSKDSGVEITWLERLVACVLRCSKRIKRETGLSYGATSVAYSAVQFMRESFATLEGKRIVLFGLGKLGRNTCRNLAKHHKTSEIIVVNRDIQKTQNIVHEFGFESVEIESLKNVLASADVLIIATGAPGYTVTREMVDSSKDLLIVDMSMPRNADPSLGELSNVRIVHVDELSRKANIRLGDRMNHIPKAKQIVAEEINEFNLLLQSLTIAPTLGLVSKNLRTFRDVEMSKLSSLDEEEANRMLLLSDKIIQKVTTQVATFLKTQSEDIGEDMSMFESVFQRPVNSDD